MHDLVMVRIPIVVKKPWNKAENNKQKTNYYHCIRTTVLLAKISACEYLQDFSA